MKRFVCDKQDDIEKQDLEQDQKVDEAAYQLVQLTPSEIVLNYFVSPELFVASTIEENSNSNGPPLTQPVPIYIRNCVFRI